MNLKSEILFAQQSAKDAQMIEHLKMQYRIARKKYVKAFDDLLDLNKDLTVDLSAPACQRHCIYLLCSSKFGQFES